MTPDTQTHKIIRIAALALLSVQVVYGFYWAGHDLSARLGLWQDAVLAQEFLAGLSLWQEFFFFSHVLLNCVVLWLAVKRHAFALPVFVLSFLFDRIDWVMMTGNTVFNDLFDVSGLTFFSFTLQALIIALLTCLSFDSGHEPALP